MARAELFDHERYCLGSRIDSWTWRSSDDQLRAELHSLRVSSAPTAPPVTSEAS